MQTMSERCPCTRKLRTDVLLQGGINEDVGHSLPQECHCSELPKVHYNFSSSTLISAGELVIKVKT